MRVLLITYILFILSHVFAMDPAMAEETRKVEIRSVVFEGNQSFSAKRLQRLMLSRPSGFMRSSMFYPEIFADDLDNITAFYQQNGYLDVRITDTTVSIDSVDFKADLHIGLAEGELTRVEGISIFNNLVFPDSVLLRQLDLKKGDPFKRNRIQSGMLSILSLYADSGYLEAAINPEIKISPESHLAMIDLTVNERQQFSIGQIRIEGLKRTQNKVVKRELLFKPGDLVRYSRLLESQRRLYMTGLFESVFIRPVASADGDSLRKEILVELKENLSSEFNISVGFSSIEKVRGRIELFTTNLAGTARQLGTSLSASFIRRAIEISFTEPRTLGSRWRTDVNLIYEYLEEPGYDLSRIGSRFTIGRALFKNSTASVTYRFENASLKNIEVSDALEDFDPRIRSLILTLVYDTRDNLFDPRSGFYLELSNEVAGTFLQGTNTFARSILRFKRFIPLGVGTVFGTSLEIGWMDYFGKSDEIPLSERFYAGGPNTLRAFDYQKVGPLDEDGDPIGGKFKLICNLAELRLPVYKMIGIAGFVDVGNVWPAIRDFRLADFRVTVGMGLRVNSPLGILRLDFGLNPDRRGDESRANIYFSMGQSF
jgi:outer membrane protein insertion porin family